MARNSRHFYRGLTPVSRLSAAAKLFTVRFVAVVVITAAMYTLSRGSQKTAGKNTRLSSEFFVVYLI